MGLGQQRKAFPLGLVAGLHQAKAEETEAVVHISQPDLPDAPLFTLVFVRLVRIAHTCLLETTINFHPQKLS